MSDHPYKTYQPMAHQLDAMKSAWGVKNFALFAEMGVGKTFIAINLAVARHRAGQINALIVVCPTAIKPVWKAEMELHCGVDYDLHVLTAGKDPLPWIGESSPKLRVLIVGVEALSQGGSRTKGGKLRVHADVGAYAAVYRMARTHRTMMAIDESSTIKNYKSIRTQRVIALGGECDYRLLMTGTPVTQGMEDLYGQFEFLHSGILGCKNFTVFKNRYMVMGGFKGKQCIGYQFEEDLYERIAPYTYQIKSSECLDLPEQVYKTIPVEITSQQTSAIKSLLEEMRATQGSKQLDTPTILEQRTRIQQIIGGNFPHITNAGSGEKPIYETTPIKGKNPKLDALQEEIGTLDNRAKVVIFARFLPEVTAICEFLAKKFGNESLVRYTGQESEGQREEYYKMFSTDPEVRFFVTSQRVGGYGLNLTMANYEFFYSNSFSYQDRYQSEKRIHRKGQNDKCVYVDLIATSKYDKQIMSAILRKKDLADIIWENIDEEIENANG